jgi:tRNA threonylcarbamoyl adenosine modification protein YeaZ
MRILAIDTCFAACSAAVYDTVELRVLASQRMLIDRGHAEVLAPMVERVMQESQTELAELGAIAVTTGPGTFTGLRIGLSFAQGMGLAADLPLIGIDTMRATAAPLFHKSTPVTVVHKAGATGQVYVQSFDGSGATIEGIKLVQPETIAIQPDVVIVGTGKELLTQTKLGSGDFDLPDAAGFAAHAASLPMSQDVLQPTYIRDAHAKPQAPTLRRAVEISWAGPGAASLLAALHQAGFGVGWSRDDIASMLAAHGTFALFATRNGVPCGMIVVRAVGGEAEILTLTVAPMHRRQRIAQQLLASARLYLDALCVSTLLLEVAADNTAAVTLYLSQGFHQTGVRKNYYQHHGQAVDALLMRKDF